MAITNADIQAIVTQAAILLGNAVPDFSGSPKVEETMEALYDVAKETVLSRHPWSCALKSASLTTVASAAGSDFGSKLALSNISANLLNVYRVTSA